LVSRGVLNHVGVRVVAALNQVSAVYHIAGSALLIVALALFAPHAPIESLLTAWTRPQEAAGRPYVYGFLVGLLQAGWTFTGYDASAHVTEETKDPTRNAPWGIMLSVIVSGVVGYVMLLAITWSIGNLTAVADAPNPFIAVLTTALPRFGSGLTWM